MNPNILFKLIFQPELQLFRLKFNKQLSYEYKKIIKQVHYDAAVIALNILDGVDVKYDEESLRYKTAQVFLNDFIIDETNDTDDYETLKHSIRNYVNAGKIK